MDHLVFISYSSRDIKIAKQVLSLLEQNQVKCWMAPRDIIGGMEYGDIIDDAIHHSQVILVIFSENSNKSQWVRSELNLGFSAHKAIVPYKIDNTPLEGAMRLMLNDKHWINIENKKPKYKELIEAVFTALKIPPIDGKAIVVPKKITRRKKILFSALALFLLVALFFAEKKRVALKNNIEQYQQAIHLGDSLQKSDYLQWTGALEQYRKVLEIHKKIPKSYQVDIEKKMERLQNSIDSMFFKIVEDGDAFASLNSEVGRSLAAEQYEKALKLKKSESVQIKLNQINMIY